MKLLFVFLLLCFTFFGQKVEKKPLSIDQKYPNRHTLVSAAKDTMYRSWTVKMKMGFPVQDDTLKYCEILRKDSIVHFAAFNYPQFMQYAKGAIMPTYLEVIGDSLSTNDRFAPVGTYKEFYPKDTIGANGIASIMFLDAYVPNSEKQAYFLPDFEVKEGSFFLNDTIELKDPFGRIMLARIEFLDAMCHLQQRIVLPFTSVGFQNKDIRIGMYVSLLSGNLVSEKISVKKIN